MQYDKTTLQDYVLGAHPNVREFINSGDFDFALNSISSAYNLTDEESSEIESSIVQLLIGLSNPENLLKSIQENTSISDSMVNNLASDIQSIILEPIAKSIDKNSIIEKGNSVGDSFEKTILNQAMAMRRVGEAPTNLPTSDKAPDFDARQQENVNTASQNSSQSMPQSSPKNAIHNYIGNSDPYREPLG